METPEQDKLIADQLAHQAETISAQALSIAEQGQTIALQAQTISEQEQTIEDQKAEIINANATIAQLKTLIAHTAETKIETVEHKVIQTPAETVTVQGTQYKWNVAKFNLKGTIILAEDASLDKELLEEIIAIEGQGLLSEIV